MDWFGGSGTAAAQPRLPFHSRRSPILCLNGCVASSQPLASSIGLQVLRDLGGNAADASVAMAAVLAVTEPCCTGLGGDVFALHYSSETRRVECVNGSGRAPSALSIDVVRRDCGGGGGGDAKVDTNFRFSPHAVTVPGAARGWEDVYRRHGSGRLTLSQLLEPAAKLAEDGFPVAPVTAHYWNSGMGRIRSWYRCSDDDDGDDDDEVPLSIGGRAPRSGEVFTNPDMANVLRSLGADGATDGFYDSWPGERIVKAVQKHGGVMTHSDLTDHTTSTFPEPIHADYRGVRLWNVPPNGQGIAGLIALKGLAALEDAGAMDPVSQLSDDVERYHAMIEMIRLGFVDARSYVCDPDCEQQHPGSKTVEWLMDTNRIADRATRLFNRSKAVVQGVPMPTSSTVSFNVVDGEGNAASFVNSNFMGFGTGIVPDGCGFSLQNRGYGFSLNPDHPNCLMPRKRPYHTILPGMLTHVDTGELYATFSNMGGYMQPQGHLQAVVNLVGRNLDPQSVVDEPRFCILDGTRGGKVSLEDGVDEAVSDALRGMGHDMNVGISGHGRAIFGKAQIIKRDRDTGVLWAGSDGRADGCAMGY